MKTYLIFILKLALAAILLQTLFFKFTASPESVYIFSKLDVEPVGRFFSAIIELIASFLLFYHRTKFYASVVIFATMTVALLSHLFILGIEIMGDGGILFALACSCFLISGAFALLYKNDFLADVKRFKS